tara:strand:+ start:2290 stop:2691 length:402 start_codon:yes stop_codon:yes gene_type:complete
MKASKLKLDDIIVARGYVQRIHRLTPAGPNIQIHTDCSIAKDDGPISVHPDYDFPTKPGYKVTYHCWSRLGHTPLTNRGSAYYDLLKVVEEYVLDVGQARDRALTLRNRTEHCDYCEYNISDHWNQNTRTGRE